MDDMKAMKLAMKQAQIAIGYDEVPVGAILVKDDVVVARGHNLKETKKNATRHAEMIVIDKASKKIGDWRLEGCTLYVTLEPCPMCAGALFQSRISRIVYGAKDPKAGALGSTFSLHEVKGLNHYPEITSGIMAESCSHILRDYFKTKRNKPSETKI